MGASGNIEVVQRPGTIQALFLPAFRIPTGSIAVCLVQDSGGPEFESDSRKIGIHLVQESAAADQEHAA